jgi:pimeloyl-ACP methyl ester carboxylesterase
VSAQDVALRADSVEVNGIRLHYRIAGSGPPLLLLHGYTGTSAWWDPLLKRFADDYTTIVPDLPGHGRSEGRSGPYRFDRVATDLHALMDALGLGRFRAIGYSGGGIALLHMATQRPRRIEAMAIVSATHVPAKEDILAFPDFQDHPSQARAYWLTVHPGGEAQVRELIASFRALGAVVEKVHITPEELSTVKRRTLLIVGDRDPLVPLHVVTEMYQALPQSALWVIPDAGHAAIWPDWGGSDQAASIFPDVVTRFLGTEALEQGPEE